MIFETQYFFGCHMFTFQLLVDICSMKGKTVFNLIGHTIFESPFLNDLF